MYKQFYCSYVTSMEPVLHNCTARVQCAGRNAHSLCHELHLCHCDLECDASLPVNEDHMTVAGCQFKKTNKNSKSSGGRAICPASRQKEATSHCCFIACICRSEAILLNLGYTLHSYCVPCQGRMGQEGMCYVGSFRMKKIHFFQTKWHRSPEDNLTALTLSTLPSPRMS